MNRIPLCAVILLGLAAALAAVGNRGHNEVLLACAAGPPVSPATTQDVEFVARCDGSTQRFVLVLPPEFQPEQTCHLLIALHGHGSDRWQFVRDGRDECRAARDVAVAHRLLFVSPDYRARTSWMGPQAEADVVQVIAELKNRYRVGKVILCGGSMGGTAALTFAVLHPELIDGVMSMNGTANLVAYDKFQDAIAASFGGNKVQVPEEYRKRSAEFFPERLRMPLAITAGGKDTLVPSDSVLRLAAAVKKLQPHVLLVYRDSGGHSTNYADARQALEFVIERTMEGIPKSETRNPKEARNPKSQ